MRRNALTRLLCLLFLCASALATGCLNVRPTPTPEPAILRYASTDPGNPRYPQLVEAFRRQHPHITLEMAGQAFDGADVVMAPVLLVGELIRGRQVMALDPYMEGDDRFAPDSFLPGTLEMLRHKGRQWGVPAGVDPLVLYYNKDLFDDGGVTYPRAGWTWEGFLARASALTQPRMGVYGYVPVDPGLDVVAFIYRHGGGFLDSLTNPTRPTFDDQRNVEALEWWLSLTHTYLVARTSDDLSSAAMDGTPRAAVYANKAAMWMGLFSERGGRAVPASENSWPAPWYMRWGVTTVPGEPDSPTVAMVGAYFVSAACTHPDAAWEWVAFLSERAAHDSAPTRAAVLHSEVYDQAVGPEVADLVREVLKDTQMLSPRIVEYAPAFEALGEQIQSVFRGTVTAQEALEHVQQRAQGVHQ